MSQKIKSLLYFICFMASAATYYSLEPQLEQTSTTVETIEMNKVDNNDLNANKVASLDIIE
ncbi:hypothetical protein [Sediminicola sp. 1XM1-17]|uniref:hypothetical protein n=1 Tax=Sediminicola sp. 1XM1-17 TaxID=3127702 RepID=UPI0030787EB3